MRSWVEIALWVGFALSGLACADTPGAEASSEGDAEVGSSGASSGSGASGSADASAGESTNDDSDDQEDDATGGPSGGDEGSDSGDDDCEQLTWRNFGRDELRSWCTGCHGSEVVGEQRYGAPAGVDFDTLEGVHRHLDRILERATTEPPTMPPVGGGDLEDRLRLRRWLECGAP